MAILKESYSVHMQAVFLLSSEEKVEFFKGTLIHKVEVHICFFFFPNIKKHLDFMDVRNLNVNICLSNGKRCLRRFFKANYFHPTGILYIKEKVHTAVCEGNCIQEDILWH